MTKRSTIAIPYFALLIFFCGCMGRQPIRQEEPQQEFFRPIAARQSRAEARSREVVENNSQVSAGAMKQMTGLRDSLLMISTMTHELLERIAKLEESQILARNKELALEQQLAQVQQENRMLSQKVSDLNALAAASQNSDVPKYMKPTLHSENMITMYEGALGEFMGHRYDDAINSFQGLLNNGIQEDLADNCEYWIGESHFAKREYEEAIASFEKVITMPVSNKKADAYVMLGQTYENLHDYTKARWAYEELLAHFPNTNHSIMAKTRIKHLPIPVQPKVDHKRAST
jgi:TolA-binding protein